MFVENQAHRLSKVRTWIGFLLLAVALGVGFFVINGQRSELAGIGKVFSNLDFYFLVPAITFECGSMAAYAQLQRSTLKSGGIDVGFWRVASVFLASNSITNVIPGGPVFASVYSYRRFRKFGATEGLAGWSIFTSNVLAAVSLLLLAGIGLVFSEGSASGISLVGALIVVGAILLVALALVARAERALHFIGSLLCAIELRISKSWSVTQKLLQLERDLAEISPSPHRLLIGFGWGFLNWTLDAAVLFFAYFATRSQVPLGGLLLAYSAGQLAANLPITPGGLGVVEGSISIALVAYGGNQEASVAAVLLYRLFSFWLWLVPGFGCYLGIRFTEWKLKGRKVGSVDSLTEGSTDA